MTVMTGCYQSDKFTAPNYYIPSYATLQLMKKWKTCQAAISNILTG